MIWGIRCTEGSIILYVWCVRVIGDCGKMMSTHECKPGNCYRHLAGRIAAGHEEEWHHSEVTWLFQSCCGSTFCREFTAMWWSRANPRKTSRRQKRGPLTDFWLWVPQLIYSCVDGILRLFIVFIYLLAAEFYCLLCTSIVWPSMWWPRRCCWQFVVCFFLLLSLGGGGNRRKWKCSDWIIGLLCLFYQIGCV